MNTHPANLTLRFLLKIAMLLALGCWGWHLTNGWLRYVTAGGFPAIAATLWGVFRTPNDPKPAPVEIPGIVRLLLEWALFGAAVLALYGLGCFTLSLTMAILLKIHYLISYDRTWAMLRNRPYDWFVNKQ